MNAVNISISTSKVPHIEDGLLIRFGLLVSDLTYSAGDLYNAIAFDDYVNKENSVKNKLDFLIGNAQAHPDVSGQEEAYFSNIKTAYKHYKGIKFKSSQEIKQLRAAEAIICEHHKISMDGYRELFSKAGLPQLIKFIKNGLVINASNCLNPEEREGESFFLMSEIILDRFEANTGDDIFMVTGNFRKYIEEKKIEVGEFGSTINKNTKIIRAYNIFVLPALIFLSADEIELVREHLLSTNIVFRNNMDKWCTALKTIPFLPENFASFNKTFINDIKPQADLLQQEMDKDIRLKLFKSVTRGSVEYEISLNICSIDVYWDYLHHINAITDESYNIIKQYPDYERLKNNSCIILEGAGINHIEIAEEAALKESAK